MGLRRALRNARREFFEESDYRSRG